MLAIFHGFVVKLLSRLLSTQPLICNPTGFQLHSGSQGGAAQPAFRQSRAGYDQTLQPPQESGSHGRSVSEYAGLTATFRQPSIFRYILGMEQFILNLFVHEGPYSYTSI